MDIELLIFGSLAATGAAWSIVQSRRYSLAQKLFRQIKAADHPRMAFYSGGTRFQIETINGARSRWRPYVVIIEAERLTIYPIEQPLGRHTGIAPDQVRWFGRPKKYHYGVNEVWLHVETGQQWQLVKLRLHREEMQRFIRTFKEIVAPELVTAYRRRRPYIHHGPVKAQPATQNVYGEWMLADPLSLYLNPAAVVLLDGSSVRRVIPLDAIQQVSALERLDQPGAAGLIRFRVGEEQLAFAVDRHDEFASLLAEAARRTLEDPVIRKKKKELTDDDLAEWE